MVQIKCIIQRIHVALICYLYAYIALSHPYGKTYLPLYKTYTYIFPEGMPSNKVTSSSEESESEVVVVDGEKMGNKASEYEDMEEEEEDEEEEEKRGPLRRCLQKTWVRVLVFIGLTGYGAFWWVNEWVSL